MTGMEWNDERPRRILERVEFYKSLLSHLDALEYTTVLPPVTLHVGGAPGEIGEDKINFVAGAITQPFAELV